MGGKERIMNEERVVCGEWSMRAAVRGRLRMSGMWEVVSNR